jgi:hypothetical protein
VSVYFTVRKYENYFFVKKQLLSILVRYLHQYKYGCFGVDGNNPVMTATFVVFFFGEGEVNET